MTRRLGKAGRNRCYVNDSSVTLDRHGHGGGQPAVVRRPARVPKASRPGLPAGGARPVGGGRGAGAGGGVPGGLRRGQGERAACWRRACEARSERLRDIELLRFQTSELRGRPAVAGGRSGTAGRAARPLSRRGHPAQSGAWRRSCSRATGRSTDAAELHRPGGGPRRRLSPEWTRGGSLWRPTIARGPLRHHRALARAAPLRGPGECRPCQAAGGGRAPARLHRPGSQVWRLHRGGRRPTSSASTARLAVLEQGEEDLSRLEEESGRGQGPGAGACGRAHRGAGGRPRRPSSRRWPPNSRVWG